MTFHLQLGKEDKGFFENSELHREEKNQVYCGRELLRQGDRVPRSEQRT